MMMDKTKFNIHYHCLCIILLSGGKLTSSWNCLFVGQQTEVVLLLKKKRKKEKKGEK